MKFVITGLLFLLIVSCNEQKMTKLETEITHLKAQNDLIREQSLSKDNFIEEYTTTLNDVYDNLEHIRKREGLINAYSKNPEKNKKASIKQKMLTNIESINDYINHSRKKLNTLRSRFKQSELTSKAFEETIEKLTKELEQKELYIASLRGEIDSLNQKVSEASFALQERDLIIEDQIEKINLAYYIIGTDDELEQKEIITDKGGILGIGSTTVISANLDSEEFMVTDISAMDVITIQNDVEDIEIISTHDPASYELTRENEQETKLSIINPQDFWRMRYLVIKTKG